MTCCELFAGIGGFRVALERAGHQVIWANEYDKYAADIYDKHFTGRIDRRDITTVPAGDIPDHDILVGGFPCQSFSVAGHRRGFDDTRGTLFFDIARILKDKQPAYCFLENVKGLLSHDGGRTFTIIIQTLDELGYDLQWQICNSRFFGVAQNRERIFIVGHLRGVTRPQIFPLSAGPDPLETSTCLDANYWKGPDKHGQRTLIEEAAGVRKLTPVECERLQGFPDGFTAEGIDGPISNTQRYKVCGNAVSVPVVEAITKRLPT